MKQFKVVIDVSIRPSNSSKTSASLYPKEWDSTSESPAIFAESEALMVKTEIIKLVEYVVFGKLPKKEL